MNLLEKLVAYYNVNAYRFDDQTKDRIKTTIEKLKQSKRISKELKNNVEYLMNK